MPVVKRIECEHAIVEMDSDRILWTIFKPGTHDLGLKEYAKMVEEGLALAEGKPFGSLADLRQGDISFDKEAQKLAVNHPDLSRLRMAEAIVTSSLGLKIATAFYLNLFKPKSPTRIFSSPEAAKEWLKDQLAGKSK